MQELMFIEQNAVARDVSASDNVDVDAEAKEALENMQYWADDYIETCITEGYMTDFDGYTTDNCVDGWYRPFSAQETVAMDVDLIRMRTSLNAKPNCMTTDVNGWTWIGSHEDHITGVCMIRE
jgi:hypothetical protein